MNWLDVSLIIVWVLFLALGARLGSVWVAACLLGGFSGAFLVDYYALPLADMMGPFTGSRTLSLVLLFGAGLLPALTVGWILSRIASKLLLGIFDSLFGLVAGALSGLIAIAVCFLLVVPSFPRLERSPVWQDSHLARPLQLMLEEVFNDPHFKPRSLVEKAEREALQEMKSISDAGQKKIDHLSKEIIKKIKN